VAAALVSACGTPSALTEADRAAIHRLDSAYVNAWLADDTAGVLATLDSGAVLMPAGQRPLTDLRAIRGFWWPDDGSRTTITSYTTSIDEITGAADLAVVRGTGSLSFVYVKDSSTTEATSRTMTLTVVTRGADGRWRISRRMWAPLAR
jgi:ketosteroid isomerase-like protein